MSTALILLPVLWPVFPSDGSLVGIYKVTVGINGSDNFFYGVNDNSGNKCLLNLFRYDKWSILSGKVN